LALDGTTSASPFAGIVCDHWTYRERTGGVIDVAAMVDGAAGAVAGKMIGAA